MKNFIWVFLCLRIRINRIFFQHSFVSSVNLELFCRYISRKKNNDERYLMTSSIDCSRKNQDLIKINDSNFQRFIWKNIKHRRWLQWRIDNIKATNGEMKIHTNWNLSCIKMKMCSRISLLPMKIYNIIDRTKSSPKHTQKKLTVNGTRERE